MGFFFSKHKRALTNNGGTQQKNINPLSPEIDTNVQHNVKLVFVGQTAVGKTSVIMTWSQEVFPDLYEPTVFDTYHGTKTFKEAEINLQIWDTAGHEDLGRLRPIAYNGADCFLVCFSLVDRQSLD